MQVPVATQYHAPLYRKSASVPADTSFNLKTALGRAKYTYFEEVAKFSADELVAGTSESSIANLRACTLFTSGR